MWFLLVYVEAPTQLLWHLRRLQDCIKQTPHTKLGSNPMERIAITTANAKVNGVALEGFPIVQIGVVAFVQLRSELAKSVASTRSAVTD